MLKRRAPIAVLLASLLIAAQPAAAHAGGGTGGAVCTDPDNPQCDVWAGRPGRPGNSGDGKQNPGKGGSSGQSGAGDDTRCTYEPAKPSAGMVAEQPAGAGGWYFVTCYPTQGGPSTSFGPVWIAGAAPVVSPEALALRARSSLRLPPVVVRLNPSGDQLVHLPTWLTLDGSSWQSRSATASVPGVSVTATARPVKATWAMGDGSSVTCTGPGTLWRPGTDPMKPSPDCGHTYHWSSASAPGAAFTVSVTVSWKVTWVGAGSSGTVPGLTTRGAVSTRVAESQAIIAS